MGTKIIGIILFPSVPRLRVSLLDTPQSYISPTWYLLSKKILVGRISLAGSELDNPLIEEKLKALLARGPL